MNKTVFTWLMLAATQVFLAFFFIATGSSGVPSAVVATFAGIFAPVFWEDKK